MSVMTQQTGAIPELTPGWRLQMALAHAGVSVEEMAEELGVHRGTVSRWLNDRGAPPRAAYVKMWALRTGVDYRWLSDTCRPPREGTDGGSKLKYRLSRSFPTLAAEAA